MKQARAVKEKLWPLQPTLGGAAIRWLEGGERQDMENSTECTCIC